MASSANWKNNTGVKVTKQNLDDVLLGLTTLASTEVLVGFPEDKTDRDPAQQTPGAEDITNAALGYIHDNGDPAAHIPARPFMIPGINAAEEEIKQRLGGAMRAAMRGNTLASEQQMIAAGMAAKLSIQNKINEGIPPPLALSTLKARAARGRKGAQMELGRRAKGLDPIAGMQLAKPLIDTSQMRNAVNFVIRKRNKRK